jgi:hypothetical protein
MVEAVITIVFMTVIMFAFLQVCIIVVDDMTANEAAFRAGRSAAVSEKSERAKTAEDWAKKHLRLFYNIDGISSFFRDSSFVLSSNDKVSRFFGRGGKSDESVDESSGKSITVWNGRKSFEDFSGNSVVKQTIKIYYYTKVMFGSLTAGKNSERSFFAKKDERYQSARFRIIPSPDEEFYYKAFPDGEDFEESMVDYVH